MMTHRQAWQFPLLILLSIPLWQGAAGRLLAIERGAFVAPVHQDKSFTMEGVTFSQSTSGVRDIVLHAKRLSGSNDGAGFTLESVDANRLGSANPVSIQSGSAHYDTAREIVTLMDGVQVKANDMVIKTPVMRYLVNHQTIKSAAEVAVTGKEMVVNGTSFRYNLDSRDFRVGERVHFYYTPLPPP